MPESIAIRRENLSKTFGRGDKMVEAVKHIDHFVQSARHHSVTNHAQILELMAGT